MCSMCNSFEWQMIMSYLRQLILVNDQVKLFLIKLKVLGYDVCAAEPIIELIALER